jgi:nitrogen fixation protein FixH
MKRGRIWIAFVIALLVGNAAALGVLVAEAGDPTPRVLPDYYKKAIAWDETVAARRASADLGWRAAVSTTPRGLTIELTDAGGAAVAGASVEIVARHRSRADQLLTIALDETEPGRYRGAFAPARRGLYELEITARRGDDTFLLTTVVEP